MRVVLRVALIFVTLLYPLGVFFGLRYFDPRTLVLLLILVAGIRWFSIEQSPLNHSPLNHWLWLPLLALLSVWTWVAQTDIGLKIYPVFVNLSLLALFAWSLAHPPSMVEKFARIKHADLPTQAIPYTKRVTQIWCGFFVFNATISALTCLWASDAVWALYNGLIAYLLMAALYAVEWFIRQRVMGTDHG